MTSIFGEAPYPIRSDLDEATRKAWAYLGQPGNWWSGAERVALVEEVRAARDCRLCADRVKALSPNSIQGTHDTASDLGAVAVEATHRLTTDAARITEMTLREWNAAGLSDGAYVEIVSIVSTVMGVDAFCDALVIPLLALPQAQPGEPSRYTPAEAVEGAAWVPMIPPEALGERDAGLYDRLPGKRVPYVIRAMSLVPDAVGNLLDVLLPFYIGNMTHPEAGQSVTNEQVELLASRVSAINECFY